MTIKGFITNLGKYNEGELLGEWITFPIDEEELEEVFKRICIDGEEYEEYFFTDWETDFPNNFGEYETVGHINEIAEQIEEWDKETFLAACELHGIKEALENSENDYLLLSNVNNNYDLGYYCAYDCYCVDFGENEILERYFDFESYGRDIALESEGCFTEYGWVEFIG